MDFNRSSHFKVSDFPNVIFWKINLKSIQKNEIEEAKLILSENEITRTLEFRFEEDQARYIITYFYLRLIIGEKLGLPPNQIIFLKNAFGKPFLKDNPVFFNISHSNTYAFIAICVTGPLGVDIELNSECMITHEIAENFLFSTEKEWILSCSNKSEATLILWCAKEAFLKAIGIGFSQNILPLLTHFYSTNYCHGFIGEIILLPAHLTDFSGDFDTLFDQHCDEVSEFSSKIVQMNLKEYNCKDLTKGKMKKLNVFVYSNLIEDHKASICVT